MSNAVYPAAVRGLTWTVLKSLAFSNIAQEAPNDYATYISQTSNPKWTFQLIYDFLKDFDIQPGQFYTDLQLLMGFFGARRGQYDDFLFFDPTDNFVGPGLIGGAPNIPNAQLSIVTDGAGNYYSPVQRLLGGQMTEDITDLKSEIVGPYGDATGNITFFHSAPLASWVWGVKWSNWLLPTLPSDAVIRGIYPVIAAAYTHDQAHGDCSYGVGYDPWDLSQSGALPLSPLPTSASFSGEFFGASIGTSLVALLTQQITARIISSVAITTLADTMAITHVGFAVYYSTATTPAAPLFAAPFTIPAGQGCAYALPLTVEARSDTGGSNGTAVGTASTQPTSQIQVWDNRVLQVAGTDYTVNGPGLAIPGASFMGMYLHWLHTPTGPVTAEFNFYFRVRFDSDMQDFENWANNWWTIGGSNGSSGSGYIKLKTSRPNPL